MGILQWYEAVEKIQPYVFKISTPRGSGTGFLISVQKNEPVCAIATAAHVIDHAHYWEEPIRIDHSISGKSVLVRHRKRAVFLDANRDTAALLFEHGDIPVPSTPLILTPKDKYLRVGNDIGWLGFPAISGANLCFFGGKISAWLQEQEAYLVDGVMINGVSGGPAFHLSEDLPPIIMGVVSAYVPNRATGEALPGLGVVRGITQLHELAPTFASLDQAKAQESPPAAPSPSPEIESDSSIPSKRAT